MNLFASHFGTYEIEHGPDGPRLLPFRHDPAPSPLGPGFLEIADHPTRIRQPMVRKGWLDGDGGAARGTDDFVPLDIERACDLAAEELDRVRGTHGNRAIFGGSYGWGSAGRFHHPQSQLKRFLNLAGGFVSARNTYSYGTASVLIPHLVGAEYADPGVLSPSWDQIVQARPFILCFGGMRLANAQVESGGTGAHRTRGWIEAFARAGGEMLTLSPDARDAPIGAHLPVNAGTDACAMLAMAHVLLTSGRVDEPAVHRIASGYPGAAGADPWLLRRLPQDALLGRGADRNPGRGYFPHRATADRGTGADQPLVVAAKGRGRGTALLGGACAFGPVGPVRPPGMRAGLRAVGALRYRHAAAPASRSRA